MNGDGFRTDQPTVEKVLDILSQIRVCKSPGPDQIYPGRLWEANYVIARVLSEISESLGHE